MTVVAHRRPHTPPMASPFLEFDLISEVEKHRNGLVAPGEQDIV